MFTCSQVGRSLRNIFDLLNKVVNSSSGPFSWGLWKRTVFLGVVPKVYNNFVSVLLLVQLQKNQTNPQNPKNNFCQAF